MGAILEAEHSEVLVVTAVLHSVGHERDADCSFVGGGDGAVGEVNLVGARGGDGHDDLAEHIREFIWGHAGAVDAALEVPIVGFGHALLHQGVVVVAEGNGAS